MASYEVRLKEQLKSLDASSSTELSHSDRDVSRILRQLPWMRRNVAIDALRNAYKVTVGEEAIPDLWTVLCSIPSEPTPAPVEEKEGGEAGGKPAEGAATPAAEEANGDGKEAMEVETEEPPKSPAPFTIQPGVISQKWILLLVMFLLVDRYLKAVSAHLESGGTDASSVDTSELATAGISGSQYILSLIRNNTEWSADYLDAKLYFVITRIYTLTNKLQELSEILLLCYRTSALKKCDMCLATVINQLVQTYILKGDYTSAIQFTKMSKFPEDTIKSTPQLVRYMFNLGRIHALQMNYREAWELLQAAVTKLPPDPQYGFGFKVKVYKFAIVTELLLGHIPSISLFRSAKALPFREQLESYEKLVLAVRDGDMGAFNDTVKDHAKEFQKDDTLTLIGRLHHAVQRVGLRKLSLSYNRISLDDVAAKVCLKPELAESIVAKAIADGVINGLIDVENRCLVCKSVTDEITAEAAETFSKRIAFCMEIYTDAKRALQYPEEESLKARAAEAEARRKQLAEERTRAEEGDVFDDDEF